MTKATDNNSAAGNNIPSVLNREERFEIFSKMTLEDFELSNDLYGSVLSAFLELDSAYFLMQELHEEYFGVFQSQNGEITAADRFKIIYGFERYRAVARAAQSAVNQAYFALKDMGLSCV